MPPRRKKQIVDKHEVLTTTRHNGLVVIDPIADGASGVSLQTLLLDSVSLEPQFYLNRSKQSAQPALYIISMKDANKGLFKMGMTGSKLLRRLCAYRTSLPLENEILVHAVLSFPKKTHSGKANVKMLVAVFEGILKANLREVGHAQQLRNTEWFRKGRQSSNMATSLGFLIEIIDKLAWGLPNDTFTMHVFDKRLFTKSRQKDGLSLDFTLHSKNAKSSVLDKAIAKTGYKPNDIPIKKGGGDYTFGDFLAVIDNNKEADGQGMDIGMFVGIDGDDGLTDLWALHDEARSKLVGGWVKDW